MEISPIDLKIFSRLLNNPIESWRSIERETKIPLHQIRSSFSKMKNNKFLRPDQNYHDQILGNRNISEVEGIYNPIVLGLKRIHILFQNITQRNIPIIRMALENHRYTTFVSQCQSETGVIYCQINIPDTSIKLLEEFCKILSEVTNTTYSIFHENDRYLKTLFDISKWNQDSSNWETNNSSMIVYSGVHSTQSLIEQSWENYKIVIENSLLDVPTNFGVPQKQQTLKLKKMDLLLIRELSINGKINISKFAKFYNVNRSNISRWINKIKTEIIEDYTLHFDLDKFRLHPYLIVGSFEKTDIETDLLLGFISKYFPFKGTITANDDKFIWNFYASHNYALDVADYIWKNFPGSSFLQIIQRTSYSYHFMSENYDLKEKRWKATKDYLVNQPLRSVFQGDILDTITN